MQNNLTGEAGGSMLRAGLGRNEHFVLEASVKAERALRARA